MPGFLGSRDGPLYTLGGSVLTVGQVPQDLQGDLLHLSMAREDGERLNTSLTEEVLSRQIELPPPWKTIMLTLKRGETKERRKFWLGEISK